MSSQSNAAGELSRRIVTHPKLDDDECLIGSAAVRKLLGGVSQMHVWRLLNHEYYRALKFVRPTVIGRRNYWRLGDVRRWIDRQQKKVSSKKAA